MTFEKYRVEIRDARGMVIGDHNVVHQYFSRRALSTAGRALHQFRRPDCRAHRRHIPSRLLGNYCLKIIA